MLFMATLPMLMVSSPNPPLSSSHLISSPLPLLSFLLAPSRLSTNPGTLRYLRVRRPRSEREEEGQEQLHEQLP